MKNCIESIDFISSAACNLNCSFCYLNKNKAYSEFNQWIREGFKNKTYIKNAYETVLALNANPCDVNIVQFWGGESLYQIQDIIDNISEIYLYFPKVNTFKVSTNFLIDIEKLFELFQTIDNITKVFTTFSLQLSIDGPGKIAQEGHNVDFEIYKKNYSHLMSLINSTKFQYLNIDININGTLNKYTYLEYFNNLQKMEEYMFFMNDFCNYCKNLTLNKSCSFNFDFVFPRASLPSDTDTTEYGANYGQVEYLWEKVKGKHNLQEQIKVPFFEASCSFRLKQNLFNANEECSELRNGITILPDGTICECSSTFILNSKSYQNELKKNNQEKELLHAIRSGKLNFNPRTASLKELEKYQWNVREGYKNSYSTIISLSIATCLELAKSGQIPSYYLQNKEQLLKDILSISSFNSCTRENLRSTGISYMLSPGTFRRYFNGAIQFSNEQLKTINQDIEKDILS